MLRSDNTLRNRLNDDVELEEKQSHAESVNKALCNEDAKSTLVHLHFRLLAVIDIAAKTFEN